MTNEREPSEHTSALRAAFDVLVCAPLGFGAMLIDDAPKAVEQARQELSNARFIGRFTVGQGVEGLRSRLEAATTSPTAPDGDPTPDLDATPGTPAAETTRAPKAATAETEEPPLPLPSELALPDYESLPAIDIVAKLDTLGSEERDAIERYERANRQRRTVLGKLAQLADR